MIQEVKAGDKIITIINACLLEYSNTLTRRQIETLLSCDVRTANRLMTHLYEVQHEIGSFDIKLNKSEKDGYGYDQERSIKITVARRI